MGVSQCNHSRADLYALEQLVDFFVCHLLPELREYVSQFACTDETVSFLVEHLKTTDELLWCVNSVGFRGEMDSMRTRCTCGLESVRAV
jgi:hypothetical protein